MNNILCVRSIEIRPNSQRNVCFTLHVLNRFLWIRSYVGIDSCTDNFYSLRISESGALSSNDLLGFVHTQIKR